MTYITQNQVLRGSLHIFDLFVQRKMDKLSVRKNILIKIRNSDFRAAYMLALRDEGQYSPRDSNYSVKSRYTGGKHMKSQLLLSA